MVNQENSKSKEATKSKSESVRDSDDDENSNAEDSQNEEPEIEKEKKFNPFDPITIFLGFVWLGLFVKMYFYLTAKTPSFIIPTQTSTSTGGEYFTSIIRMKELARLEQSLIAEMNDLVRNPNMTKLRSDSSGELWLKGLSKIKTYLRDYESSIRPMLSETADVEEAVVSHPLISFRMLRRIVVNLADILQYNVEGRLNDLVNVASLIEPAVTIDDVTGAIEGILRLQTTFLISPSDFADGRLQNYETKSGLTSLDCYHIGTAAITDMELFSTAVEWLVQALRMVLRDDESNDTITIGEVRKKLRHTIAAHNRAVGKLPKTFGKAVDIKFSEMTKDNENELMKTFPSHPAPPPYQLFSKADISEFDDYNFKGLCRGDKLRNETLTKRLKCYYKSNNPFLAIKPLKVEVHSYDPLILQFYDIIPDYIINHFKTTTSHQLQRALVSADITDSVKGRIPSKYRISCSHFADERKDEIFSRLPKIIYEVTGLNLLPEGSAEFAQVSTYGAIGGYYIPHFDNLYDPQHTSYQLLDPKERSRGDRIATIMFYLSNLKLGGGTAFPKIGVLAEPVKGSGIFWYNLKKNGDRHRHTLHGGCPVLLGEKWVINKWIRSSDQMFRRKCSLDSNK